MHIAQRHGTEFSSDRESFPRSESVSPEIQNDPLERVLARTVFAPPIPPASHAALAAAASQLMTRCLVSGDGKCGKVRLELGAGSLSGSVVELAYDAAVGQLDVEITVDGSEPAAREQARAIRERLLRQGFPLGSFSVE